MMSDAAAARFMVQVFFAGITREWIEAAENDTRTAQGRRGPFSLPEHNRRRARHRADALCKGMSRREQAKA
jgi:hypothetical protein